jgi:hypothetical protein
MRHLPIALACLVLLAPAARSSDTSNDAPRSNPAPRNALTGADCLNPSAARAWHVASGNQLLVDAGRRKYRITLWEACTELGQSGTISFRGDAVSGRVCGNVGERVQLRRSSCRIDRVELIDAETFAAAATGRRGTVSASTPTR